MNTPEAFLDNEAELYRLLKSPLPVEDLEVYEQELLQKLKTAVKTRGHFSLTPVQVRMVVRHWLATPATGGEVAEQSDDTIRAIRERAHLVLNWKRTDEPPSSDVLAAQSKAPLDILHLLMRLEKGLAAALRPATAAPVWVPVAEWGKEHQKTVLVLVLLGGKWVTVEVWWDKTDGIWRYKSGGQEVRLEVFYVTPKPVLPPLPTPPTV